MIYSPYMVMVIKHSNFHGTFDIYMVGFFINGCKWWENPGAFSSQTSSSSTVMFDHADFVGPQGTISMDPPSEIEGAKL